MDDGSRPQRKQDVFFAGTRADLSDNISVTNE